jgi:hypothetical protein
MIPAPALVLLAEGIQSTDAGFTMYSRPCPGVRQKASSQPMPDLRCIPAPALVLLAEGIQLQKADYHNRL